MRQPVSALTRYGLTMKRFLACATIFVLSLSLPSTGGTFTTVTVSTSAPVDLEASFISQTTSQFDARATANPLAANTYTIKLFGFKTNTFVGNALDDFMADEFGDGMDSQRDDDIRVLQGFQGVDITSGTCAGLVVDSTTYNACQKVYALIGNTIAQSGLAVYNSTGGVVSK